MKTHTWKIVLLVLLFIAFYAVGVYTFSIRAYSIQGIISQRNECTNHVASDLSELDESLKAMGLRVVFLHSGEPHLARISKYQPPNIKTQCDIDVLLSFVRIVSVQQFGGFSWDSCVDVEIHEYGLHEYWLNGWRSITESERSHGIIAWAEKYTFDELRESVFRYRPCLLSEFQAHGFFRYESLH